MENQVYCRSAYQYRELYPLDTTFLQVYSEVLQCELFSYKEPCATPEDRSQFPSKQVLGSGRSRSTSERSQR